MNELRIRWHEVSAEPEGGQRISCRVLVALILLLQGRRVLTATEVRSCDLWEARSADFVEVGGRYFAQVSSTNEPTLGGRFRREVGCPCGRGPQSMWHVAWTCQLAGVTAAREACLKPACICGCKKSTCYVQTRDGSTPDGGGGEQRPRQKARRSVTDRLQRRRSGLRMMIMCRVGSAKEGVQKKKLGV